jgi:hypothetical protein
MSTPTPDAAALALANAASFSSTTAGGTGGTQAGAATSTGMTGTSTSTQNASGGTTSTTTTTATLFTSFHGGPHSSLPEYTFCKLMEARTGHQFGENIGKICFAAFPSNAHYSSSNGFSCAMVSDHTVFLLEG